MMQRLSILILVCVIIGAMAWLYVGGIKVAVTASYEPPSIEHAPRVYHESRKVKWKRTKCSRCHTDSNAEFAMRMEL